MVKLNCNFCDGDLNTKYETKELVVGLCEECGLKQLTNFNHIDDTFYYNIENLVDDFRKERERQHGWNEDRIHLINKFVGNLNEKSVIDYGCGTGSFLDFGKNIFNSVVGFDLSVEACELNNNDNLECHNDLESLNDNYDILTLFHVLEHVKKPLSFLKSIIDKFNNTKLFVIEVPHTDEALISIFKNKMYMNNHYSSQHLWYFTEKTLKMVLEKAGLKVVYSNQIQRYPMTNHFKWLSNGIKEDNFFIFEELNDIYEQKLIQNKIADSLFVICERL